jgi:hypothetical protein
MRSWAVLFSLLLLPACGGPEEASAPPSAPAAGAPDRCARCLQPGGSRHACGATRWCDGCGRDVGHEHRCGRTAWCDGCRREIGEGHLCGKTEICQAPTCLRASRLVERGPNHVCGRTTYCLACGTDRGMAHDCRARMHYCPRCDADATDEHVCGRTRFCPDTDAPHERILDASHRHGETRYCRGCDREVPVKHEHPPEPGTGGIKD